MVDLDPLDIAREQYKAGNKLAARDIIIKAISRDKKNPDLWFGLSFCLDDEKQIRDCLERVLKYNPEHTKAKGALEDLNNPTAKMVELSHPLTIPNKGVDVIVQILEERKRAGSSTREEANRWRSIGIIAGIIIMIFIAAGGVLFQYQKFFHLHPYVALALFLIVISSIFWGKWILNPIFEKMEKYKRGARAEEKVGSLLEKLGPNFLVLNDVQTEFGNIDHVVISKNGHVYAIETKSHIGNLEIDGNTLLVNDHKPEKDFIAQSLGNAFWLRDKLEPLLKKKSWVTPVLVFTRMFVPFNPPVRGVHIVNIKFLK